MTFDELLVVANSKGWVRWEKSKTLEELRIGKKDGAIVAEGPKGKFHVIHPKKLQTPVKFEGEDVVDREFNFKCIKIDPFTGTTVEELMQGGWV
jgi:hypothetical protein